LGRSAKRARARARNERDESRSPRNGISRTHEIDVLSFGHSLQKDLADKGVRIQTVLPGATATEFWDVAGYPAQKASPITMPAADLVDAALSGLDQSELVTIPGLQEGEDWTRWEEGRRALGPKFNNAKPSPRYGVKTASAA
jgi:short-subunit dehydrogenase